MESLQENLILIFQQDHDNWPEFTLKQMALHCIKMYKHGHLTCQCIIRENHHHMCVRVLDISSSDTSSINQCDTSSSTSLSIVVVVVIMTFQLMRLSLCMCVCVCVCLYVCVCVCVCVSSEDKRETQNMYTFGHAET